LLARTLVEDAVARGVTPAVAQQITEAAGRGVEGTVEGHHVLVGSASFALERNSHLAEPLRRMSVGGSDGEVRLLAFVIVDGRVAGAVEYADELRAGAVEFFRDLNTLGLKRTILLSGDHAANARAAAAQLGISQVEGDLLPQDKVERVNALKAEGEMVLMVGDGTNDAPALSAATVGIAMAGHGGGITAEAADLVLLADDLSRVADAIRISRRTMRIARQGIRVGLGLSSAAMLFAAAGMVTPVFGALLQEAIDLAVILNALRASSGGR